MSKVCAEPGCPTLTTTSRCPEHHREQRRKEDSRRDRDPAQVAFYHSTAWRKMRKRQLREFPLCQCDIDCCPAGCYGVATEVDHIDGNWRNNDRANHRSLTKPCHSRKTVRQDGAFVGSPPPRNRRATTI